MLFLSKAAKEAHAYLVQQYVEEGYRFSAAQPDTFVALVTGHPKEVADHVLEELISARLAQRRKDKEGVIELTEAERKRLMVANGLDRVWQEKLPPGKEVWEEAADLQLLSAVERLRLGYGKTKKAAKPKSQRTEKRKRMP